ncbi:ABC transporter permease [Croceibacter atlanticus]|jgi:putative ABC transport system permease protein|uniref:ABC transporter permease n=1 Tax=Croceibacter atlanticus TaxID=313588 RepID=UPI000C990D36|nr:ABC transporter permease [Croceibacter atlanticus]MAM23298.1 ABC transporter ATP-binding protein [Croceibacter sp.]WSP34923.1 ABC transporter permease [Croceibacter atlanticus]HAT68885.1 ABC transporter ATP-binding protein [Flavobacteriaceae bacterium]|tara:strand:+ start:2152 stop:3396 length:1245 start_codon:yes stop_codon:yes gene_type:complete
MFNIERWQEIFQTIAKNKLRTFLTGVSVASGIFILVILLGFGQGMENGISKEFQNDASNRISVWSGVTTVEHKGLNPGRFIQMKNKDFEFITKKYSDKIENKSSLYRIWNGLATYGKESGSYRVEGVHPDYQFLENETLTAGRYLNQNDIDHNEKVVVLGHKVKRDLFKEEDAIGKQLQVSGVNFKVVGVYTDPGGEREEARIFLPITTSQKVFNGGNIIRNMAFTLQPKENFEEALIESEQFSAEIQDYLKQVHTIAPNDMSAINVNNTLEQTKRFYDLIWMIRTFFWGVGICTIIAGVVGVSNIMLIIVKERTREIGVRKALGAQPWSIIGMILHESIFVTAIAGFTGLVFSMALLEIIGPNIEMDYILNPSVNFNVAITTVFILIIAGAIAGFFPAWRAASIKPIEALRDE